MTSGLRDLRGMAARPIATPSDLELVLAICHSRVEPGLLPVHRRSAGTPLPDPGGSSGTTCSLDANMLENQGRGNRGRCVGSEEAIESGEGWQLRKRQDLTA